MARQKLLKALKYSIPYKSIAYYQDYVYAAESIIIGHQLDSIRLVHLFILLHFYYVVHSFYLATTGDLTNLERLASADIVHFLFDGNPVFYFAFTLLNLMSGYFYYELYLRADVHFMPIARIMFFTKCRIQSISLTILNAMQFFPLMDDLIAVYIIAVFSVKVIEHFNLLFFTFTGVLLYIDHLANLLAVITCLLSSAHVYVLAASLGMSGLAYLYIVVNDNLAFLQTQLTFHWAGVDQFIMQDIHNFSWIFIGNRSFANIFCAFVLCNGPISAYLAMLIFLGQAQGFTLFVSYFLISLEMSCIFVMHLFIAYFTKRAHSSSAILLHISTHQQHKIGNFRGKIRLTNAIARLHTTNKYGIHYGSLGLVTLGTFAKCILLYGELLMYAYKFIQDI